MVRRQRSLRARLTDARAGVVNGSRAWPGSNVSNELLQPPHEGPAYLPTCPWQRTGRRNRWGPILGRWLCRRSCSPIDTAVAGLDSEPAPVGKGCNSPAGTSSAALASSSPFGEFAAGIRELRQDLETYNRQRRARGLAELERSVSRLRARAGRERRWAF